MTLAPNVLEVFASQFGVASRGQLLALGVSRWSLTRWRQRGLIEAALPDAFVLAGTALSFEGRCMAVLLHFGDRAYLSGTTAAALLGARSMSRSRIVVTVDATTYVGAIPDWVHVHRSAWHVAGDVITRPDGLRLSSPLRTLLDLAAEFNEHRFARVAEDLWHLGLASPDDASDYLAEVRRSGRRGVKRLEAWLESVRGRFRATQSGLELDAIEAIRAVGLPEPHRQYPVRLLSGEVVHIDVAWPDVRFGVEPGHSWWHGGDLKQRADQDRDRACGEVGWDIKRFDESMRDDVMAAARQIKRLYEQRRLLIPAS
jgi:putative AbiEi antitoxin of type IV toxin-antitoxin system